MNEQRRNAILALFAALSLAGLPALAAPVAPVITGMEGGEPAHAQIGQTVVFMAEGLADPVRVFFSDGNQPTIEASPVVHDPLRGVFVTKVPVGSVTGNALLSSGGVDADPYYFRVDAGTFDQGTRSVSGEVSNGAIPVPGALVVLLAFGGCDDETIVDYSVTDAFGQYAMTGGDGDHEMFVFAPSGSGLAGSGASVTLGATPSVEDIVLAQGIEVSGRVVRGDAPATGVANARVDFESEGHGGFDFVLTDANGDFTLYLAPGPGFLEIEPPAGELLAFSGEMDATIDPSGPQSLGDVPLAVGVEVSGFVRRDSDGTPLANVEVQARPSFTCCDATDSKISHGDGSFSLVVPPNEEYDLQVWTDDDQPFVNVYLSNVSVGPTGLTQDLDLEDAGFITGVITDADTGMPVVDIGVQANEFPYGGMSVAYTRTCEDGSYRLRVPPSGTGYLTEGGFGEDRGYVPVTWDGTATGTLFVCEGTALAVPTAGTEVANVDLALPPNAAAVSGRVLTQLSGCTQSYPGQTWVNIDDGIDRQCSLGGNDFNAPFGTYRVYGLPHSGLVASLRACVWGLQDASPQCYNLRQPPGHQPIFVDAGNEAGNIDFCVGDTPGQQIDGMDVRKTGDWITISWDPTTNPYHDRYRVWGSATVRPSSGSGNFPNDPPFTDLYLGFGTEISMPADSSYSFFLVTDVGITGVDGPSGSYGD